MSSLYRIFDQKPESTQQGDESTSFTCPDGKYARVSMLMSASAWAVPATIAAANTNLITGSSNSVSVERVIWVNEGQVVDGALSNAAASSSSGTSERVVGHTTVTARVDSNAVGVARATAFAAHVNAGSSVVSSVAGTSSFHWFAEIFSALEEA